MKTQPWMLSLLFLSFISSARLASAQTYTFSTPYSFPPSTAVSPKNPSGPIIDVSGNLYGVSNGGTYGFGTVFKVTGKGELSVLHNFSGNDGDGNLPTTIIRTSRGIIYGETFGGGAYDWGTIFKLTPEGDETILHSFPDENLFGSLMLASTGDLYGYYSSGDGNSGFGSVFKLNPHRTFSHIYTFCSLTNCADGYSPAGPLIMKGGNLYGTTQYGGQYAGGSGVVGGVVFELTPEGQETVLHSFGGVGDGDGPTGKLTQDSAGNLFGTTQYGGTNEAGIIFKIDTSGVESVLYNFCSLTNCADGRFPEGPVIVDAAGNLYGVTSEGGSSMFAGGTVYRLSTLGLLTVLHDAGSGNAGLGSKLVVNRAGNFYGMTFYGGTNHTGTVYKLTKQD